MTPRFDFAYVWIDKKNDLYIADAPESDNLAPLFLYTNDLRYAKLFDAQGTAFNWKLENGHEEAWELFRVQAGPR